MAKPVDSAGFQCEEIFSIEQATHFEVIVIFRDNVFRPWLVFTIADIGTEAIGLGDNGRGWLGCFPPPPQWEIIEFGTRLTVNNRPRMSGFSMHCSSCGRKVLEEEDR